MGLFSCVGADIAKDHRKWQHESEAPCFLRDATTRALSQVRDADQKRRAARFPVLPFLTDRIPIRPVPRYSFWLQETMCFLIK